MEQEFLTRRLLVKSKKGIRETYIFIRKPDGPTDGLYTSFVEFREFKKYSANIKGCDELHAVQCAIEYIDAVCRNSSDPEFFISEEESLLKASQE